MSYKTISEMFYNTVTNYSSKKLFYYKKNAIWNSLTGDDIKSIVEKIAFALHSHGIEPQDKVSILSTTNYRWPLCDYGIISLGAVSTTVYPTLLPEQIKHIIIDSDSKLVFVEDSIQLEKIKSIDKGWINTPGNTHYPDTPLLNECVAAVSQTSTKKKNGQSL